MTVTERYYHIAQELNVRDVNRKKTQKAVLTALKVLPHRLRTILH